MMLKQRFVLYTFADTTKKMITLVCFVFLIPLIILYIQRFDPKNIGDQRIRRVLEKDEHGRTIYDRYNFNNKKPTQLPIEKRRNEIIDQIEGNTITILTGPTGCGNKTVFISKNNFFYSLARSY